MQAALKGDKRDAINAKAQALAELAATLVQAQAPNGAAANEAGSSSQAGDKRGDDVIDAEFSEVDNKAA